MHVGHREFSIKGRTNEEWLADLRGAERDRALADLRVVILRGLKAAFVGRVRSLDATVEDFAQDTLVKVLENLDTFRGESRFTTWAQGISMRVAYTELRRRRWRDVSLQELLDRNEESNREPEALTDRTNSPQQETEKKITAETLEGFIVEELTQKQRDAIVAVMFQGMPLEEAAQRMRTNRNALYKLLHDARKKLKRRLEAEGLSPEELLKAFGDA